MGTFDDVEFVWGGVSYTIKADRVLGAIARIEDVITLDELGRHYQNKTAPRARIAMAYGAVLRYAGANASDDDVYNGMFEGQEHAQRITEAVSLLLAMMLPHIKKRAEDGASRPNPTQSKPASSKRSTERRSAKAG